MTAQTSITDHYKAVLEPCLSRAYRVGYRGWEEALWRTLELAEVRSALRTDEPGPILDVGCGNGDAFGMVFGNRPDATGIDPSPTEVQAAQQSGVYGQVQVGDARKMPFPDASFALIFSNSVLEHVDNVDAALGDMARVLKPGGRLVFTTPHPRLRSRAFYYWRHRLAPIGLDRFGIELARREDTAHYHVSIRSFPEWERALHTAGFASATVREYIDARVYRVASKLSGAKRGRGMVKVIAGVLRDPMFRLVVDASPEAEWIERCRPRLLPYLRPLPRGAEGAGQLIIATRPAASQPADQGRGA